MDRTTIKKTLKDFFVKQILKKTLRKFVVFIIYNVYLSYAIYCQAIQPTCTGNGRTFLVLDCWKSDIFSGKLFKTLTNHTLLKIGGNS
jgi:hypothetical protein